MFSSFYSFIHPFINHLLSIMCQKLCDFLGFNDSNISRGLASPGFRELIHIYLSPLGYLKTLEKDVHVLTCLSSL